MAACAFNSFKRLEIGILSRLVWVDPKLELEPKCEDCNVSKLLVAIEELEELNFVVECDGVSLGYPLVAAIFFKILTKEVGETLSFIKSNSILNTSGSRVTPLKLHNSRSSSSRVLEFVRVTVTL